MDIGTENKQKLTKDEVQRIADLARVEIAEDEKDKYAEELSAVLAYVEQLKEVDTEGVKPTAQVTGLINVVREDEAENRPAREREKILNCAPAREDDYLKVKAIL